MGDELAFKSEYAKSGRASCKGCSGAIAKDSLRLAIMIQSPHFDGKVPNWYHYACFWKRTKCTSHTDIGGFNALRWEDQKKIKDKIAGSAGEPGDDTVPGSSINDFVTEYAKSNRSKCRGCNDTIDKDEVRISKKDYESERAKRYGPQDEWYHVDCFVKERDDLGFGPTMPTEKILGFGRLKGEDKDMLLDKLGKGEKPAKRKNGNGGKGSAKKPKKETAEEKSLREQSQLLWKIRDALSKEVSNTALKVLLELNKQGVPPGESRLLDAVTDCMAFGAMLPCEECKGHFVLRSEGVGYKCSGNLTEWTKCINTTMKPGRKAFKIPPEFHDVDFLKKYKYVKRDRVFASDAVVVAAGPVSSKPEGDKPLAGWKIAIIGNIDKAAVSKTIMDLGATVVTSIDKKTAVCVSSKEEVENKKNKKLVKLAKDANVYVVKEEFLEASKKGGAALFVKAHSLCDWGSDPIEKVDVVDGPVKSTKSAAVLKREERDEKFFTKSVPATQKMKLKGGAAVDPDSELEDRAHVLQEKGDIYNVVLGLVDVVKGMNSYYKLQILEADSSSRCWLFRSWGRVGTTIGGNKLETCGSKNSAIQSFKELYAEKTGNLWENRNDFKKQPNKFFPLDIDYGSEEGEVKSLGASAGTASKLPKEVQDLIKMIFDVETMKKAMMEFEIDLKKMPLGKLSKKQIESAYKVLNELNELIDGGGSATRILDATNRFYTLIPHDFGMKKAPLLDTAEVIKTKTEMLDNLLEIEIAYSMLKSGDESSAKDPIDVHYEKLKTKMEVVDRKSDEFKMLQTYIKNTHAATHSSYTLKLEDVFKVEREGENKRFKPFKKLGNRKLLWHGSRITNFAGILSQGLRIAPPEAPVTGYMFGKGVYFADMVSKSANYCWANASNPTGLLLLCDVALGNMYELTGAQYITKLPPGKQSTKGLGRTAPDPAESITTDDGVEIPTGKGIPVDAVHSSLLYNEYIVYDVAQINVKYLLRCDFQYKW